MDAKEKLGKKVKSARFNLGYKTRTEFASKVGVSSRILSELENGRRNSYSDETLWNVDRALEWPQGTSKAILEGKELPTTELIDSSSCAVTAGISETTHAAASAAAAYDAIAREGDAESLAKLSPKDRAITLCLLHGRSAKDIDLLTNRDAEELLAATKLSFMRESRKLQAASPRYSTEPTSSGFTRKQIDDSEGGILRFPPTQSDDEAWEEQEKLPVAALEGTPENARDIPHAE